MISEFTTQVDALLRNYHSKAYETVVYQDNTALGLINKDKNAAGDVYSQPISIELGPGFSATVGKANSNAATEPERQKFLVDWGRDYGQAKINNVTIQASRNDKGAVIKMVTDRYNKLLTGMGNRLERDIFGDGYGTRGFVGSISTNTITLTNVGDTVNFGVGDVCQFAQTPSSASFRNSGTEATVTAIDPVLGTVTFNDLSGLGAVTAGDSIHGTGDKTGATPIRVLGFQSWLPRVRTSIASIGGVTRTTNPEKLAGIYVSGIGDNVRTALFKTMAKVGRLGGKPDVALVSYGQFVRLQNELDGKVMFVDVQGKDVTLNYKGIRIAGPKGAIDVVPATFCPDNCAYVLTSSTWTLGVCQSDVFVSTLNNGKLFDSPSDDTSLMSYRFFGALICSAPGWNGVCELDLSGF